MYALKPCRPFLHFIILVNYPLLKNVIIESLNVDPVFADDLFSDQEVSSFVLEYWVICAKLLIENHVFNPAVIFLEYVPLQSLLEFLCKYDEQEKC